MTQATIYLVDDEGSVRESMGLLLRVAGYRVESFVNGESFLVATLANPGCILLDMNLGGLSGQAVLEALSRRGNQLPVIVLTAYGDIPMTVRAMQGGASDLIPKTTNPEVLLARIEELLALSAADRAECREAAALRAALATLSAREREVLALAAVGFDTRHTAEQLAISPRTVEVHRSHIARKCGVDNLAALFRVAALHGVALA